MDVTRGNGRWYGLLVAIHALVACGDDGVTPRGDHDASTPVDGGAAATPDARGGARGDLDAGPASGAPTDFTLAVIPDTQYLFDQDRGNAEVLATSLRWIVDHAAEHRIVFSLSLGDIVENAHADELAAASDVYTAFDRAGVAYSVVAGNHDLRDRRADDVRAPGEPYLALFGPQRFATHPTFGGATSNGFNTYHVFEAAGRRWLVLALDWRVSDATIAWAQAVLDEHPALPTIVATHDLAYDGGDDGAQIVGDAALSSHGQRLWDRLIRRNDQVFLALGGHYWPAARTVLRNDAGHDVHVHVTNYQDRYYGGSGMIRLYRFDLADPARGRIDVSTFSPWVLAQAPEDRSPLELQELELLDADNHVTIPIDVAARFASLDASPPPEPVPADRVVIAGTVAYWRFDTGVAGAPLPSEGIAVRDLSGHGNDLVRVTLAGGAPSDLVWTDDVDPRQPSRGALFVRGEKTSPPRGAYLRTADDAMLNALTFDDGFTIEAFVRLPADCCGGNHAWMGVLSRMGTGADLGRTADDPQEPTATLAVPPGGGLQWAVWPRNTPGILTSWSHQLRPGPWIHVAIVNDGQRSIMHVDGAEVLRNPRAAAIGLSTTGEPWLIGAGHYGRVVEQSFYGWLGDVRVVARALPRDQWMIAARR